MDETEIGKNPCELIWRFLDGLPETIRGNFMAVVALAFCAPDAARPDWDYEADLREFLKTEPRRAAEQAAMAIGVIELHFARPSMPDDDSFIEEMDALGSTEISAIARRQPLVARHKESSAQTWQRLRESQLSFQALAEFEADHSLRP